MRFYAQGRTTRILLTLLWVALGLFWIDVLHSRHGWPHLVSLIWIALPLVQMATMWSYWEVTETHLQYRSFLGNRPSLRLSDLVYVGDVRRDGWMGRQLKKSTEIQFDRGTARYISVADRDAFRTELRRAGRLDAEPAERYVPN